LGILKSKIGNLDMLKTLLGFAGYLSPSVDERSVEGDVVENLHFSVLAISEGFLKKLPWGSDL
jgi:hypothetical protein